MERVLDIYKRPFDPLHPVICMDESPKQLISETKTPKKVSQGQPAKHDYEYKRCGVCNIFLACEPLAGKRFIEIKERRTKQDWALFLKEIAEQYEEAEQITLVLDNQSLTLNVKNFHRGGAENTEDFYPVRDEPFCFAASPAKQKLSLSALSAPQR